MNEYERIESLLPYGSKLLGAILEKTRTGIDGYSESELNEIMGVLVSLAMVTVAGGKNPGKKFGNLLAALPSDNQKTILNFLSIGLAVATVEINSSVASRGRRENASKN